MSCFFMSLYMQAADGETFTANTPEGIVMTFKIISEANKTVQVGRGTSGFEGKAIDSETSGHLTIPSEVTHSNAHYSVVSIGDYSLAWCRFLTSVTIPYSVTTIGEAAFEFCSNLSSIKIPNGLTAIADYAFYSCKRVNSVTIPNSVKTIGNMAFSYCSSLESLVIPNNVTSIGMEAFSHCSSLASITVDEKNSIYDSRDDCNAIIETSSNTLIVGCQKTIIPNSVTTIGYNAFDECSNLTSIIFPNSVTTIRGSAFKNCSGLTTVTIPNSVKFIGDSAFSGCTNLSSIIVKQAKPIIIYSGVFSEDIYQNCVLYIPKGQYSCYINENGWSSFIHVEEMEMPDAEISKSPFANIRYNQMVLGHHEYSDEYKDEDPLFLSQGIYKFCIGYSKEQMKPFIGNKITHARFALVNTDISSVKLWISAARDTDPLYTQNVSDIKTGWNEVKLEKAFDIQDDSVFIGIEYVQNSTNCPISYQYGAEILGGSFYLYYPNGKWVDIAAKGGLCARFQCLVEGDKIPLYDIHTKGIYLIKYPYYNYKYVPNCFYYKPNELITGYLQSTNWGKRLVDEYEIAYKLDDQEIGTSSGGYFSFTLPDLSAGIHTVTIYIKSINGEKPLYTDDDAQSILIKVYDKEMDRQKVYIESFTATWCPYTIGTLRNLKNLTELRDDISLVQLHSRDGLSCDAVDDYSVFYSGTPQLSSNRSVEIYSILEDIETVNNTPSFANVNISANYNHNNRELKIKVAGERNEEFIKLGEDVNLTVLLTEDNITNPQYDGENERYIYDYSHQAVLRTNVSNVWGDPIEWNNNKYENTYSILLDENWVANNMKIVAFLAKPFTGNNYDEISVMNCNDFAIKDANMDVPSYTLTYMVDGNTHKTYQVEYGATITAEKAPTKEGYTFSGWSEIPTTMPAKDIIVTGYFTIIPLQIAGDVTGNGSVNVQDATIVVNYILGTDVNDEYDYSVADMNNDGEIDVFDVTKMIAVILSEESSAKMRKTEGVQEPAITEQLTIENAANGIILKVDQANRFTSFQMDVVAPDGISLTEVHLSQNETDHIVRYAKIGENQYRVMALSMNSTPLQAYSDRLLELGMNEGDDVQIDNILFVTPQGEAVPFSIISDNITTDIMTVGISEAEDIYDLSGRKINVNRTQLPKGVYIINKKKVFIK